MYEMNKNNNVTRRLEPAPVTGPDDDTFNCCCIGPIIIGIGIGLALLLAYLAEEYGGIFEYIARFMLLPLEDVRAFLVSMVVIVIIFAIYKVIQRRYRY